jgi:hypothetical protein
MAALELHELGLTPTQLAELRDADQALVTAWLEATSKLAGELKRPAGYLLAGVRSGEPPAAQVDRERELQVHLAERFIVNAGWLLPTEAELVDELFGRHGKLRAWAGDELLVSRMVDTWKRARQVPDIQWPQRGTGAANPR